MAASVTGAKEVSEGRAQLLWAGGLVVLLAALFFGKKLANVPTPFGIDLGGAMMLAVDALWLTAIVWKSIWPPMNRRDAWFLAAVMVLLPLMHLLTNRQSHALVVAAGDLVVAIAGTIGGLSIFARHLWGAR